MYTRPMRILAIISFLILSCIVQTTAQASSELPRRYAYTVTGVVTDENSQPVVGIRVCAWDQSGRPINGRIPCTETKLAGRYELKFQGTPEKYSVWSNEGRAGMILVKRGKKRWGLQSIPLTVEFGPTDGETRTANLVVKRVLIQGY